MESAHKKKKFLIRLFLSLLYIIYYFTVKGMVFAFKAESYIELPVKISVFVHVVQKANLWNDLKLHIVFKQSAHVFQFLFYALDQACLYRSQGKLHVGSVNFCLFSIVKGNWAKWSNQLQRHKSNKLPLHGAGLREKQNLAKYISSASQHLDFTQPNICLHSL